MGETRTGKPQMSAPVDGLADLFSTALFMSDELNLLECLDMDVTSEAGNAAHTEDGIAVRSL